MLGVSMFDASRLPGSLKWLVEQLGIGAPNIYPSLRNRKGIQAVEREE
jgi:hypothetical protein